MKVKTILVIQLLGWFSGDIQQLRENYGLRRLHVKITFARKQILTLT